jgi:hypothetical protein
VLTSDDLDFLQEIYEAAAESISPRGFVTLNTRQNIATSSGSNGPSSPAFLLTGIRALQPLAILRRRPNFV